MRLWRDRLSAIHAIFQEGLWRHARIRIHDGKTQFWKRSYNRQAGCDVLDRAARALDPALTTVWKGEGDVANQGIRIFLGRYWVTRITSESSSNASWLSMPFCWNDPFNLECPVSLGIVAAMCQCAGESLSSRGRA